MCLELEPHGMVNKNSKTLTPLGRCSYLNLSQLFTRPSIAIYEFIYNYQLPTSCSPKIGKKVEVLDRSKNLTYVLILSTTAVNRLLISAWNYCEYT